MAFILKDRVKESTTTTGTGNISLGGALATFDTFQSYLSNGDTTFYAIAHASSGVDEWEVGLGTWNTGNTLSRTTVLAGSNGTSAVTFSAGTKDVFMTYPASKAIVSGEDAAFANITVTGTVDGRDIAADGTKLDGVEASADVTDTANVTSAGALMRSGGTMTGNLVLNANPSAALGAATKQYVDTEVSSLVDSAPSTLDTLNELAAALGDDANFSTTVTNSIATKLPLAGGTMTAPLTVDTNTSGILRLSATNGSPWAIDLQRDDVTNSRVYNAGGFWSFEHEPRYYNGGSHQKLFHDGYHPNADKWTTARTLSLSGDASGSVSWDGSANATLSVTVANDSHTHVFGNITSTSLSSSNDLNSYNVRALAHWGGSNPSNSPATYGAMFVIPDGSQPQQLVQTYGGAANKVSLYGRRKTGGTWDTSWTQYFSDHYHPNADKWTTARTLSLSGDASGSVSWDGSANATLSVTVANDSHTHDGRYYTETEADSRFVNVTGDTMTGRLILPDGGYSIGNEYHTWKRSYVVNNTSPKELLYHDGNSLPSGGAYRFHAHIDGTGTDQSATAVYWNQNGTWKVNVTYQSGTSSNHPEFIIGGSPEKPQIHIDHSSNYTIQVLAERLELTEGTGTDNQSGFGTDAFLGSVGGTLRYNNGGSVNSYAQGDTVFHDGYHPNADAWTTARTLSLTGDVTGSVSWDGSGNASLAATVANDSHSHKILKTSGNYVWSNSTTAGNYPTVDGVTGVQTSFVRSVEGWPEYGVVLHVGGRGGADAGGDFQLYCGHGAANGGNYLRVRNADNSASPTDSWTSWRTIWDSGNDGSGSGLDADLLDGVQGSSYLRSDANDTFTGDLTHVGGAVLGAGTLTGDGQNDIFMFGTSPTGVTAQSGGYHNKLRILGGSGQSRDLQLYQRDSEYAHIGSSWTSNQLTIDSAFTQVNFNQSVRAPIFYDSNDTTYYVDPASTGSSVRIKGNIDTRTQNSTTQNNQLYFGINNGNSAGTSNNIGTGITWAPLYTSYTKRSAGILQIGEGNYFRSGLAFYTNNTADASTDWSERMRLDMDGNLINYVSVRAPIYYDSNNTSFYIHPDSNSRMAQITVDGGTGNSSTDGTVYVTATNNNDWGLIVDKYNGNSSEYGVDIRMGSSFNYGFRVKGAGSTVSGISSGQLFHNSSVRGPIFYDSANTSYYVDPASTSRLNAIDFGDSSPTLSQNGVYLRVATSYGYIELGPANSSYAHINTDRPTFYFNKTVTVDGGGIRMYDSGADVRAFAFYDQVNTGFYVDPSSTGDSIRVAGNIVAYYSDERLKDIEGNIDSPLEKVSQLNGFYYTANKKAQTLGYKDNRQVGVSAQEVEAVMPEVVTDAAIGHGYKTVDYAKLVPLLIEAVKEQQDQIETLKSRLEKLEN